MNNKKDSSIISVDDAKKLKKVLKICPTNISQKEMWSSIQFSSKANISYNLSVKLELEGEIDQKAICLAYQDLIYRYTILNAVISKDGESLIYLEELQSNIETYALENYNLEDIAKREVNTPFDINLGPLIRVKLFYSEYKSVLFFTVHHLICDGWSLEVLLSDLSKLYSCRVVGEQVSFNKPLEFFEYKKPQNSDLGYWKEKLLDFNHSFLLPTNFQRPINRSFNSARFIKRIDEKVIIELKKVGISHKANLFTIMFTTYGLLLHKITKASDLIIGFPVAEQAASGHHDLIGHFVKLLPLRIKISQHDSFLDLLEQVKLSILDALDHQNITFGSLVEHIKFDRKPGEIPLINNTFNLDIQKRNQGLNFSGVNAHYRTVEREFENFELFTNIFVQDNFLEIECQYNTSILNEQMIQVWFSEYDKLLKNIVLDPNLKLNQYILNLPETFESIIEPKVEIKKEVLKKNPIIKKENIQSKASKSSDLKVIKELIQTWEELLGEKDIPTDLSFFSLGGHSLLAIKMIAQIKERLKVCVSLNNIFNHSSIEELASFISESSLESNKQFKVEYSNDKKIRFELSKTQMRSLFLSLNSDVGINNLPTGLNLGKGIDITFLKKSVTHFVNTHSILLSKLVEDDGSYYLENSCAAFEDEIDIIHKTDLEITDYIEEQFRTKFDLFSDLLFKTKIFINERDEVILFFMPHHIVWDGWCFDLLINEVSESYELLLAGKALNKSSEKKSFADYCQYLDLYYGSEQYSNSLNYWHDQLKGELPILDLPLDYLRPSEKSVLANSVFLDLGKSDLNNLKKVSSNLGVSVFNILLGVFKIVLHKYSSMDDIIVGLPTRNRPNCEFDNTIGYFVNSIAVRTQIDKEANLSEYIKRVSSKCFEAYDNEMVIFEDLINLLGIKRDPSTSAIFQSFFTFQDTSNRSNEFSGNSLTHVKRKTNTCNTDLDLWMKVDRENIMGAFVYPVKLFDEISIQRLSECFEYIIKNINELIDKNIQNIDILPLAQRDLLLEKWNTTAVKHKELGFVELFLESVKLYPESIAISCDNYDFTYSEVDRLSNSIASELVAKGCKPSDLIGISVDRDSYMLISLIGILKTGAGYVPLDPSFPLDRLTYMIESSGLETIIVNKSYELKYENTNLIVLEDFNFSQNTDFLAIKPDFESLMYVIYTSGSTGNPKGVELPHRSVSNFLQSMKNEPGFNSNSKLLAVTTLSFDIAVLELYTPLISGGCVYIASKNQTINGDDLNEVINTKSINIMQATPSTWRLLEASKWNTPKDFTILCGGEPFPKDLASTLLSKTENVWNMYGPTETTVWSTCKKLSSSDKKVLIGKPIDNTNIYILDESLKPVPIGSTGELYIGGAGLAHGYKNRDDLTEKVFIDNNPYEKLIYNTGDLARYHSNGEIECLGRNDGQVKVRGFRIELGEIESQISKVSHIVENIVMVREDSPGDIRLVAYIRSTEKDFSHIKLRKELSKNLPHYMIPTNFVVMDSFPKTLNEKIDKKNLPSPSLVAKTKNDSKEKTSDLPIKDRELTQTEKIIFSFWKDLLKKDSFGVDDNFFDIGGHSIMSVSLFTKLEKTFEVNLKLNTLLEYPTISLIAEYIDNYSSLDSEFKSLISINDSGEKAPFFFFHGVGGNVLNYVKLYELLFNIHPIYGLESQGIDGKSDYTSSVKEMSEIYAQDILKLNYKEVILCGGSMGGILAIETAKILKEEGVKIKEVIMFDTAGPNFKGVSSTQSRSFSSIVESVIYRFNRTRYNLLRKLYLSMEKTIPHNIRYFFVEEHNMKVLRKHRTMVYNGDVTLYRAPMKASGLYSDPSLGWSGVILGKINNIFVDADHATFVEKSDLPKVFIEQLSKK